MECFWCLLVDTFGYLLFDKFDFTRFTSIVIMVLWTNPLKILEYNLGNNLD